MKLLLDTCTLLWALSDNDILPNEIKAMIDDENNDIYYSFTSLWEIQIKNQKNKELMPVCAEDIADATFNAGVEVIQFDLLDLHILKDIINQNIHKDPFDHMLLAMARANKMTLVTHDKVLGEYKGVKVLCY